MDIYIHCYVTVSLFSFFSRLRAPLYRWRRIYWRHHLALREVHLSQSPGCASTSNSRCSRLPCSAFVVSYNAMIVRPAFEVHLQIRRKELFLVSFKSDPLTLCQLPPVQFLLFFFILLRSMTQLNVTDHTADGNFLSARESALPKFNSVERCSFSTWLVFFFFGLLGGS